MTKKCTKSSQKLTMQEASQRLGTTPRVLGEAIKQNVIPWGYAVKHQNRYSFILSRERFETEMKGAEHV